MKKTCSTCKEEKHLSDFRKDQSRSDGYRSDCKLCARSYHQSKYTERYGEKARQRVQTNRDANKIKILEIKLANPCLFCKESEPICLDFHHPESEEKEFGIANNTSRKWEQVEKEIAKCVVLCSNCHKKVHAGLISLLPS